MKKILQLISLCLIIIIFLSSCNETPYLFKESIDEIDTIEIVSAENSLEFTVIKTLSETEKECFLEQFQEIKFYKYIGDPSSVYGNVIKINYQSGAYEMICFFSAEYVEDGVAQFLFKRCNEEEYNKLINNFLE